MLKRIIIDWKWHKLILCEKKANNQKNSKPKWSIYFIMLFFPLKGLLGWWWTCFLSSSKSLLKTLWRAHWELVGVDLQPQGFYYKSHVQCDWSPLSPILQRGPKKTLTNDGGYPKFLSSWLTMTYLSWVKA